MIEFAGLATSLPASLLPGLLSASDKSIKEKKKRSIRVDFDGTRGLSLRDNYIHISVS